MTRDKKEGKGKDGRKRQKKRERRSGRKLPRFIPPSQLHHQQFLNHFPLPLLANFFRNFPVPLGPRKKDDQTIRRGRRTTDDPGTPPRPSGSPSGGEGIPAWTRHIFSHPERGQGGPGGESADRYGDGGAAEARGLEDTQEGCESQLPGGSNGSRILAPTSVSVGWKTLRGGL